MGSHQTTIGKSQVHLTPRRILDPLGAFDLDGFRDATWRELVADLLAASEAPIAVADLYRAFRDHPKTKSNPHWQAKLRQTLQRGAGRAVARDQWVAA